MFKNIKIKPSRFDICLVMYSIVISFVLFFGLIFTYAGDGAGSDSMGFSFEKFLIFAVIAFPAYFLFLYRCFWNAVMGNNFSDIIIPAIATIGLSSLILFHYYILIFVFSSMKLIQSL